MNRNFKTKSLSHSLLKGTVVNLGIQALNKNLNKNNFWQTLLVGATSGLGDYFGGNTAMSAMLGSGNALINDTKFLSTTAKYAAIGGAADLLLNVTKAKAENLPEKNRWQIRIDYHLPNGNLPFYHQTNPTFGCTQETLKSIGEYLRVPIFILDYPIDWDNGNEYKNGADFMQLARANGLYVEDVEKKEIKGNKKYYTPDYVGNLLLKNYPLAITYQIGDTAHTVGINRIIRLKNIVNPQKSDRYIIQVMDPLYKNEYKLLPLSTFKRGVIRLVSSKSYA